MAAARSETASPLGDVDLHLFNEGRHTRLDEVLGAHAGDGGVWFAVWAPNAKQVSVVSGLDWQTGVPMSARGASGIWEAFVPGAGQGTPYKYRITPASGAPFDKADPFALRYEKAPRTASIVWDSKLEFDDQAWLDRRKARNALNAPMSIYEVHLGSWMRVASEGNRSLSYREIAPLLGDHAEKLGFTHVEIMPVMEHPFFGSWGYQVTGYFAPTERYGTPEDFAFLVDHLHKRGIGVILDWVPAHFPTDAHALAHFDGSALFEHADPREGFHPEWTSAIFNYGRHEVRSFLLSSASSWIRRFHVDGLRVDGVASMLYRDYGRKQGEWLPNKHGGRENLEAIDFLRQLNEDLYRDHPDVQTIAEESTAWPMVSRPTYVGGLGFGMKWDMGWMHDALEYFSLDPVFRKFEHQKLTFRRMYAYSENFVLPLSHDEVVYGKKSLLAKMPGDEWQRHANLRLLLAHQWSQPGKKLLFMGGEIAQPSEWNHDGALDWSLLDRPLHRGCMHLVGELNRLLREPAMHELDFDQNGFAWIDPNDADQSVLSFERRGKDPEARMIVVMNCTPLVRRNYRIGVDIDGRWEEALNTDAVSFGGSGQGNLGGVEAAPSPSHGRPFSLVLTLPPLGALFLRPVR